MAACSTWTYRGVTPRVFQALRETGKRRGFAVPGTASGNFTIQAAGIRAGFHYVWDNRRGLLHLTCVSKPVLVSCSLIKGTADSIIRECGGVV